MAVGDDNGVDRGNFAYVARLGGVSLRSQPGDGRATILKDRVEEYSHS